MGSIGTLPDWINLDGSLLILVPQDVSLAGSTIEVMASQTFDKAVFIEEIIKFDLVFSDSLEVREAVDLDNLQVLPDGTVTTKEDK